MITEYSNFRILGGEAMYAKQRVPYPLHYFIERECVIDCRFPDVIEIEDGGRVGWFVTIITTSHDFEHNLFGNVIPKRTVIRKGAFVCAYSKLYNCEVGEGAVVALGGVVRSQKVEPYCMVAGNPAVVIKRQNRDTGKWERV